MESGPKTILFVPMEWGLGHTVRLVPWIRKAVEEGNRVILASDGLSLNYLRTSFPDLQWVRLPFYPVRYPQDGRFFRKLMPQIPGILRAIRSNKHQLDNMVREFGITHIYSDHRYGMAHPNTHSIFITNQLWLLAPKGLRFTEPLVYWLHCQTLRRFSEIWIADSETEPSLSGKMTHPPSLPQQARFIGPVSRFKGVHPVQPPDAGEIKLLGLVSGPEPQRTIFESLLTDRFERTGVPSLILRGLPATEMSAQPARRSIGCVILIDHAPDEHIAWYILHAGEIFCRPGQSTLADLVHLKREAILVPTPGQTEQEYAAAHLKKQGTFRVCLQADLTAYPLPG